MDNILKLYGEEYLNTLRLRLSRMAEPEGVAYFLTAINEEAILRQLEFDKYLALAFMHNIIDDDLLNRIVISSLKSNLRYASQQAESG